MDITMVLLAFVSGCIGTFIGGMQAFVLYGLLGIFMSTMMALGLDVTWYNQFIMSFFFLPAVMFSATVPATAYAAKHYDIEGWNIARSLSFTKDPLVVAIGGLGGVVGYLLFMLAQYLHLPMDQGAFSVIVLAVICRIYFNKGQHINMTGVRHVRMMTPKAWAYEIILGLTVAVAGALFVQASNNVSIGFYFSAFIMGLQLLDPAFPVTHHITMVAGYAVMATGSIAIATVFGILAHIIFLVFAETLNTECGTHIDPPAIAIGSLSLIIFTLF